MKRVTYINSCSTPQEENTLVGELNKILTADKDRIFRFVVMFTGGGSGLNNFLCKVYFYCGDETDELLATLQRGDAPKMKHLIEQYCE